MVTLRIVLEGSKLIGVVVYRLREYQCSTRGISQRLSYPLDICEHLRVPMEIETRAGHYTESYNRLDHLPVEHYIFNNVHDNARGVR